jgi:hypothetical protein
LHVFVYDRINEFRLPEGIFLEPGFEVRIEDWNERHRLLALTATDSKEIILVFLVDELGLAFLVSITKMAQCLERLVEISIASKDRLSQLAVRQRQTFLDTANKVAEDANLGWINPLRALVKIEQTDHATCNVLICHVLEIHRLSQGEVVTEPHLLVVFVEALDDIALLLLELS